MKLIAIIQRELSLLDRIRATFKRKIVVILFLASVLSTGISKTEIAKSRNTRKSRPYGSARYVFYTHLKRSDDFVNPNGAKIIKSSHFDYEFFLGEKIVFICSAKGLPRPRITWYKDGVESFAHPSMQISEWMVSDNEIKSKLEIDPAREIDSGNYECQADNKYAIDSRSFKADLGSPHR